MTDRTSHVIPVEKKNSESDSAPELLVFNFFSPDNLDRLRVLERMARKLAERQEKRGYLETFDAVIERQHDSSSETNGECASEETSRR